MPAEYTNVTADEIKAYLTPQGFKQIYLEGVKEIVYGKRVDSDNQPMTLRIYTGIEGTQSRACGEDAMRATIFWRTEDGDVKMIGGSKRVHRVKGWKKNLQKRIDNLSELLGPSCGRCKAPMVLRNGKNGEFWGCVLYPACKHSQPLS